MAGRQGCRVRENRKIDENKVIVRALFSGEYMPFITAYVFLHRITLCGSDTNIDLLQQAIHDGTLFRSLLAEVTICHAECAILQRVPALTIDSM